MRPDDGSDEIFEEMTLGEHLDRASHPDRTACISIGVAFIIGMILAIPMLDEIQQDSHANKRLDIRSPTDPIYDLLQGRRSISPSGLPSR